LNLFEAGGSRWSRSRCWRAVGLRISCSAVAEKR